MVPFFSICSLLLSTLFHFLCDHFSCTLDYEYFFFFSSQNLANWEFSIVGFGCFFILWLWIVSRVLCNILCILIFSFVTPHVSSHHDLTNSLSQ